MSKGKIRFALASVILLVAGAMPSGAGTNALLTDIKILYVYEQPGHVDWALVYNLSAENGCHIDLATFKSGPVYKYLVSKSERFNLHSFRFYLPDTALHHFDSAAGGIYGEYLPDIVIFSGHFNEPVLMAFENYLLNIPCDTSRIFSTKKFFRCTNLEDSRNVYLNARQYLSVHYDEIYEMALAVSTKPPPPYAVETYSVYNRLKSCVDVEDGAPSFLSGVERLKFDRLIEKYIGTAIQRAAFKKSRDNYVLYLKRALHQAGLDKINSLLGAMVEAKQIRQDYYYQIGEVDSLSPVAKYIERTIAALASAIFREAEIDYQARVEIRDTPEGKKLKFKTEIDNKGVLKIRAGWLEFKPSWRDSAVVIDDKWAEVMPHNSLIREYTVDVDPKLLESVSVASLEFIGRVECAGNEVDFRYQTDVYEKSALSIEFVPDFLIIKPFPKLQVDHLVEATGLKAVLRKPAEYTSRVGINVETPPGLMAGAYKQELTLSTGQRAVELEIPLVMTGSAGTGRLQIVINVIDNGSIVATDAVYVRQAAYDIPSNVRIAVLPDQSGLLEDILIETGATYKTMSDRYLSAGDFDLYDAVFLGTGCFRNYPSLEIVNDKLRKYMEYGGTVVVFGQPDDWRDDLLPVSIISTARGVAADRLTANENDHVLFKDKFKIGLKELLSGAGGYISYPAVVFPGRRIIEGDNNTTVFSQTKFGKGRLIYCGLPLLEMVRDLDTEAIKLFSNLVHYSGK
jgi:hypothetical protein